MDNRGLVRVGVALSTRPAPLLPLHLHAVNSPYLWSAEILGRSGVLWRRRNRPTRCRPQQRCQCSCRLLSLFDGRNRRKTEGRKAQERFSEQITPVNGGSEVVRGPNHSHSRARAHRWLTQLHTFVSTTCTREGFAALCPSRRCFVRLEKGAEQDTHEVPSHSQRRVT